MRRVIWSLTPTLFWQGGENISLSQSVYLGLVMLDIHSAEPLVPEPSASEVEMAVEKQKKTPLGIDQMPAELIKAQDRTIHSKIYKLINSVWNKEELPEELKELIVVHIYNKGNETDCINCRGISLVPATYRILLSILLSKLTPCAEEIIGDCQCGF
jgi:hypothetical protein